MDLSLRYRDIQTHHRTMTYINLLEPELFF